MVLLVTCNLYLMTSLHAEQDESALNTLKQYIADLNSLNASFKQSIYGQSGDLLESATGMVSMEKPGKFYWAYQQPYSQYLISDGISLWIYDEDLEQVTINNINQNIRNSPASILGGEMEIDDNYTVTDIGVLDGINWIELISNKDDVEFNAIRLGFKDGELTGMVLFDNFGQITQLLFNNVIRNQTIDSSLFEFNPPLGIDIIDARVD